MKTITLSAFERHSASMHYRCLLPLKFLAKPLEAEGIRLQAPKDWSDARDADAVVYYRAFKSNLFPVPCRSFVEGRPVFWDCDDNLYAVPKWSPAYDSVNDLDRLGFTIATSQARGISVSTEPLREAVGYPAKTVVLPNLVDADAFKVPPRRTDVVTLLWSGSPTHEHDLNLIVPALRACRRRLKDKLRIVFYGYCPPAIENDARIAPLVLGGTSVRDYPAALNLIAPDVAVCPLSSAEGDVAFNRCKSAIKFYESALAGAIVVASRCQPYSGVIWPSETGYLADDDEWVDLLPHVLDKQSHLNEIRDVAREDVIDRFSWQNPANHAPWLDWFRNMVA